MFYNVKAYNRNPSQCEDAKELDMILAQDLCKEKVNRNVAMTQSRYVLRSGYWLEVYDAESGELMAGPFDPDSLFPRHII